MIHNQCMNILINKIRNQPCVKIGNKNIYKNKMKSNK